MPAQPNLLIYAITIVFVVLMLSLRLKRMKRTRPLKLNRIWIMPIVFIFLAALTLAQFPPQGLDWVWLAIAALIGAGLGWQRGRLMHIMVDPQSRALTLQASPMAIYFLIALLVIRMALRTGLQMEGASAGLSARMISDIFIVFAGALFTAQQAEMSIRAKRLLAATPTPAPQ